MTKVELRLTKKKWKIGLYTTRFFGMTHRLWKWEEISHMIFKWVASIGDFFQQHTRERRRGFNTHYKRGLSNRDASIKGTTFIITDFFKRSHALIFEDACISCIH